MLQVPPVLQAPGFGRQKLAQRLHLGLKCWLASGMGCALLTSLAGPCRFGPPLIPLCSLLPQSALSQAWLAEQRVKCYKDKCRNAGIIILSLNSSLLRYSQAWLAEQRVKCYEDGRASLHAYLPRCLVPLTPSLDQAGGLARLTLRGHASEVTKVRFGFRILLSAGPWLCGSA